MPMYYFHASDSETLTDVDGTELADDASARTHARDVVRELMFRRKRMLDQEWSDWTMAVHDGDDVKLFSFPFTDVEK